MDPKQTTQLDPTLKAAYDRVMGTATPPPATTPPAVSSATPPIHPLPTDHAQPASPAMTMQPPAASTHTPLQGPTTSSSAPLTHPTPPIQPLGSSANMQHVADQKAPLPQVPTTTTTPPITSAPAHSMGTSPTPISTPGVSARPGLSTSPLHSPSSETMSHEPAKPPLPTQPIASQATPLGTTAVHPAFPTQPASLHEQTQAPTSPLTAPHAPVISQNAPVSGASHAVPPNIGLNNPHAAPAPVQPAEGLHATVPLATTEGHATAQTHGFVAPKKKAKVSPVILIVGAVVFLVAYTLFWVKFFNIPIPFISQ